MQLDVPTLMVAGAFVALMSGALLLYAWYQYRETRAALWWAGADFALACAIVLMAIGSGADIPLIFLMGLTFLCVSATLTWAGARAFDGHPVTPVLLALGTIVWIAAQLLPASIMTQTMTVLLNGTITLAYYGSAAVSIKLGKGEALRARLPLVVLLATHALTLLIAVPASLTMTLLRNQPPPALSWFGVIHFEILLFAIGTAIFMVAMMKERSEGRLLATAHTDPLTGVANRRGFILKAERILERCRRDRAPVAIAAFDLDRFKAINDSFGHAAGDRVLEAFVAACGRMLRPSDLLGRLGGKEFVVIMPGAGPEAGYAVAERIRKAVAETGAIVDGDRINCTVSGGVASSAVADDIDRLLREADIGLYRAKSQGRNRIERAGAPVSGGTKAKVIHIA